MNKRERKMLDIHRKNSQQDISSFSITELAQRVKLQDYLYVNSWRRTENWLINR